MNRRHFLESLAGAGALAGGALTSQHSAAAETQYPYAALSEAMAAAGFDPAQPGCFTCVWTADTHYGTGDPVGLLPPLIRELNAMAPLPAFFGIAGDLICKASLQFGQVPDDKQKAEAIEEFRLLRKDLETVDPNVPVRLALGNHDTYPGEDEPVLFHTVFPEHPEYQSFAVEGVQFVFLNGGSSGFLDEDQRKWFRTAALDGSMPRATTVLVVHQPSLGSVTAELGIPEAVREALSEREGDLWMVSGHHHRNHDACFRLPKAVLTQATLTTGNPEAWGTEHPGYWVWCFAHGKLAARIFRRLGQGYRLAPPPPLERAQPIPLPFEGREGLLWQVLVGEGDKPYLVEAKAAWCLNYWHYNRHLIYRFPLSLAQNKAERFLVLATPSDKEPPAYFASPNGTAWTEIAEVNRTGSYTSFAIPPSCLAAEVLHVRLEKCVVSGFALTTEVG